MKKFFMIFSYAIAFCFIIFFGTNIFLNDYFNNYFYKTPNLIGMTIEETEKMIPKGTIAVAVAGKDFSNLPAGEIFMQEPSENKVVKRGRTVKVWVSAGENSFEVPNFYGQQLFEVRSLLEEKGIKIKEISRTNSDLAYNCIIATTPGAGSIVDVNKGISILVSNRASSKTVRVPDVIGYTLNEAKEVIKAQSLFVGEVTKMEVPGLESNVIVDMSVSAGSRISAGSNINLVVSK